MEKNNLDKKEIDIWITKNYSELKKVINGMAANHNFLKHSNDLFNNSYMHVVKSTWPNELELRKAFINYAKMQMEWNNTQFKKEIFGTEEKTEQMFDLEDISNDADEKINEHIDYQLQKGAIELFRLSLRKSEDKILFFLYFSGKNSRIKLSEHFTNQNKKMSSATAARLLKKFRNGIMEIYIQNGGHAGKLPNRNNNKK